MKRLFSILVVAFFAIGTLGHCAAAQNNQQSVQIYSAPNNDGAITTKTIDSAFDKSGLTVSGDNNMNSDRKSVV